MTGWGFDQGDAGALWSDEFTGRAGDGPLVAYNSNGGLLPGEDLTLAQLTGANTLA
jgi:hypothetical protein